MTRTDSIMQHSYRGTRFERRAEVRERYLFVQVFNVVAAFDGERLLLARVR